VKVLSHGDLEIAKYLFDLGERIIRGHCMTMAEAEFISSLPLQHLLLLIHTANRLRVHFCGKAVTCCSIVNAKSGSCPEDCAFCAQSALYNTNAPIYPFIGTEKIVQAAIEAARSGATGLGIVISGEGIMDDDELEQVGDAMEAVTQKAGIEAHGSLGVLEEEQLRYLKSRGMVCFNHNLETARSFFEEVVTTHSFGDRLDTARAVKRAGIRLCCGGILGLGESPAQRIELAMTLRELDVDIVSLNFLHPIPGTPLQGQKSLPPLRILSIIALFRLMLPTREIKITGGRERNLRDLQSMVFAAGADGIIIGNYLTTPGRSPEEDLQMLRDLGLSVRKSGQVSSPGGRSARRGTTRPASRKPSKT
jgi:biotin synthase